MDQLLLDHYSILYKEHHLLFVFCQFFCHPFLRLLKFDNFLSLSLFWVCKKRQQVKVKFLSFQKAKKFFLMKGRYVLCELVRMLLFGPKFNVCLFISFSFS